MNFPTLILLAMMCISANAAVLKDTKAQAGIPQQVVRQLKQSIRQNDDCTISLCFVVDGHSSISDTQFAQQKDFISQVLILLSARDTRFAAVQFGSQDPLISMLTDDTEAFRSAALGAELGGGSVSSLPSAITMCASELEDRNDDIVKIVVLSGDSLPEETILEAAAEAEMFQQEFPGGVCAISVDSENDEDLERIVGEGQVFDATFIFNMADVVEEMVEQVCNA